MEIKIQLPIIEEAERTPTVVKLLGIIEQLLLVIQRQSEEIEVLKDEIRRLKGHKGKPNIKPSKMDEDKRSKVNGQENVRNSENGINKKVTIHKVVKVKATKVPPGSRFKGYHDYDVQELVLGCRNTRYRLERWGLPDGSYLLAKLPKSVQGYHFGHTLRSFIDYQNHNQGVTQPLLLEQLRAIGFKISSGELNHLLVDNKETFHAEKDAILPAGIEASRYIHVDDTGARHAGKNGYCTHIGNELFTWFSSTQSKSRINFLGLLRCGYKDYVLNEHAIAYMKKERLRQEYIDAVTKKATVVENGRKWKKLLSNLEIKDSRSIKIITEAGLMGSVLAHGFPVDFKIISDDAGQFNVFQHALCWIHAERKINELIPLCEAHNKDIKLIRSKFWRIYRSIKKYKLSPNINKSKNLEKRFVEMCITKTSYQLLNNALKRLLDNKDELLLVLKHPELPLHNNLSERDIREYVKKRKISGGTRSDNGRRCRDTYASLKKTCRKLGVNFWEYLLDRNSKANRIPKLPELIQQASCA